MSELATLARPYAAAVFKRTQENKGSAAKWSDNLSFMSAVVADPGMNALIGNPKINKSKLINLILDVCGNHVDDEGKNFLKLLATNHRLSLLPKIAQIFEELKAEAEGYISVDVFSAFPFAKDEEKKFATTLEKNLKKKVLLNMAVDKSLIGGVLVRAGDRVIDGSIKGQLENLRKSLQ